MKFFNAGVLTVLTMSLFTFGCGESTTDDVSGGLTFSKTSIVFDRVLMGESNEQTITVENTGDEPISIDSVELRESGQDGYSEVELKSSMDGTVIQPKQTQSLTLVWTPKNNAADVGFVTINSANQSYVLSFEAPSLPEPEPRKGALSMSAQTYTFDYTTLNGVALLELKGQNTGASSLQILDVTLEEGGQDPLEEIQWKYAPFGPDNAVLQPGDDYIIAMKWTPKNTLYDEAVVRIKHTEGTERIVVKTPDMSVPPVPKGIIEVSAPRIVLYPESTEGVEAYEWTITNTSDQPVELGQSGIKTVRDMPGQLLVIPDSDETMLMPGQTRKYVFRWEHRRSGLLPTAKGTFYLPIKVQAYALDRLEIPIHAQGLSALTTDQPIEVDAMDEGELRKVYVVFENDSNQPLTVNDVFWSNPNGAGQTIQMVNWHDFKPTQSQDTPYPEGAQGLYELTFKLDSLRPGLETLIFNTSAGIQQYKFKLNANEPLLAIAGVVDNVITFNSKEEKVIGIANESRDHPLEIYSIHITNADHASFKLATDKLPIELRNGQVAKLQPRAQLQLPITYDVAKPATGDAYLTIRTNDPRRPNLKVRLRP